jgi:type 1 glutamine amidotransferase
VIELKEGGKKKGRVVMRRALNQQSFGNCEGWNFIVGKKHLQHRQKIEDSVKLQHSNNKVINSLSTYHYRNCLNNMWVNCGAVVNEAFSCQFFKRSDFNMHEKHF